jgi:hypothetical protein
MGETKRFDEAFDKFIESYEYEVSRNALFSTVRLSFMAGWKAAGGEPPPTRPALEIAPQKPTD